jgi:formylglycine-generating enzyme required for sulfatase activity
VGLGYQEDILLDVIESPSSLAKSAIRVAHTSHSIPQFSLIKGLEKYPVTFVTWYGARAYCQWKYKKGSLPS